MKQVGLLNVDGYYNFLLSFIDKAVDEGFIAPAARHIIVSAQTAHELLSKLEVRIDQSPLTRCHGWQKSFKFNLVQEQEYATARYGVAPKLRWEMEQLGLPPKLDIAR